MKRPLVNDLQAWPWSSYPGYVGKAKTPRWLYRDKAYQMLGSKQRYKGYAHYVNQEVDEDTLRYYQRGNMASIIGGKEFKTWVYDELLTPPCFDLPVRKRQPVAVVVVVH